ncbi:MAG: beta-glucuronidase, partial [Planctomycetota bacterium]|nr:beta-glucuronidase [Planctomycetota bacterium]
LNLNGYWTFAFDPGRSGAERGWMRSRGFDSRILVPFCPESRLSGLGNVDFIERLWYHRTLDIPAEWQGQKILLHFGGVDYEAEVFLDGERVGHHWGGSTPFSVDLTARAKPGARQDLVVHVRDELRAGWQPAGKQAPWYQSAGCHYTRTTGIWSTVWLESVHPQGLADVQIIPVFDERKFIFLPVFYTECHTSRWRATVRAEGRTVGSAEAAAVNGNALAIALKDARPWSPASPFLYDVIFEVFASDGSKIDEVNSYAGLRKVHCADGWIHLNNEPIYLRFVLDQGFYPDGIWTAPTDAALKRDIELALAAGFNGARLHQKVFDERFHWWADRLGYLTWAEFPSWGVDCTSAVSARAFLSEWAEAVCRDRNHPSIIAWTPLNETVQTGADGREHRRLHQDAYDPVSYTHL